MSAARAEQPHHRHVWKRRTAKYSRWLHIYLSMFSCVVVLFFAVTGITLNRPELFAAHERVTEGSGTVAAALLDGSGAEPDRLGIVEYLRATHGLSGVVTDFRADDVEIGTTLKGPGYSADVVIDRETGKYQLSETRLGLVAVMNDLHKGRDSGTSWKLLIDISAVFLTFVSLTGLILIYFVHKHRFVGLVLLVVGGLLSYGVYAALVP
jgi:hypothetical protein